MKKFYNSPELEIVKFQAMERLAEGEEHSIEDGDYVKDQYPTDERND